MPPVRLSRCWKVASAIAVALFAVSSATTRAAEPAGRFEVSDVSLWITGQNSDKANSRSRYPSALPVTVNSVREAQSTVETRREAPINLITFRGQPTPDLDVDLRTKAGSFLAHWPPGSGLPNRLRWSGTPPYQLVEKVDDESELMFVDDGSWIAKARRGDALFVKRGARSERFLAYDVELELPPPIRLEGGPDKYHVINSSDATVYDVLIARVTPQGVRVAWIDELPKSEPVAAAKPKPQPKPRAKPKPPARDVEDLFKEPAAAKPNSDAGRVGAAPAEVKATTSKPATSSKLFGGLPGQAKPKENDKPAARPKLFGGVPKPDAKAEGIPTDKPAAKPKLFGGAPKPDAEAAVEAKEKARLTAEVARRRAIAAARAAQARAAGGAPPQQPATEAVPPGNEQAAKPAGGLFGGVPVPEKLKGVDVTMSELLPAGTPEAAAQTADALVERLVKAGLSEQESRRFVDQYSGLFFEDETLVVACRLAPATIDEKIPLSIFPAPAKTVRVAMVVVRNADPQLRSDVDRYIAQLGDSSFAAREEAQERLLELGPLAFPKLQQALKHADPEIVIRCERILLRQNQKPDGKSAAVQRGAPGGGQFFFAPAAQVNR